jgi:hypothetical protein
LRSHFSWGDLSSHSAISSDISKLLFISLARLEIIKLLNFLFLMVQMLIQFIFSKFYAFILIFKFFHLFLTYFISFLHISSLSDIFHLFLSYFISFLHISSLSCIFRFFLSYLISFSNISSLSYIFHLFL